MCFNKGFYQLCCYVYTVQLNVNSPHVCRHTRVLARLTHAKLRKLAYARTVAREFGVCMWDIGYTQHTRNAHHELTLG